MEGKILLGLSLSFGKDLTFCFYFLSVILCVFKMTWSAFIMPPDSNCFSLSCLFLKKMQTFGTESRCRSETTALVGSLVALKKAPSNFLYCTMPEKQLNSSVMIKVDWLNWSVMYPVSLVYKDAQEEGGSCVNRIQVLNIC